MTYKYLGQEDMETYFNEHEEEVKLDYLCWNTIFSGKGQNHFFCAFDKERLVGVLKLRTGQETRYFPGVYTALNFVSVNSEYKGQSIATKLFKMVAEYADKEEIKLIGMTDYDPEGKASIPKILRKLNSKVSFLERKETLAEHEEQLKKFGLR